MKHILVTATALSLLASPLSTAFAQGWNDRHDDNRRGNSMTMQRHDNDRHDTYRDHGWRRGGRIDRHDWDRGRRVNDWQRRHLQRPPRGYEWRQVDNNYVLAAVAGGLIASVILAGSR